VNIGDTFKNERYVVLLKLGWGHFSTVWLVHDRHTYGLAALKIQKSATHYTEAARDEIRLLSQIRDGDADDDKCCCRLLDTFEHSGPHGRHVCMLFEVLGDNLLALIKRYKYRGIPLIIVRSIARQVLVGLDYLHRCAAVPRSCYLLTFGRVPWFLYEILYSSGTHREPSISSLVICCSGVALYNGLSMQA
jgi:serine/threonine-protein kinase SRPK3